MDIDFVGPWIAVGSERVSFEEELRRELSSGNALSCFDVRAIGRRVDCDDVLFEVCNEEADFKLALVHLTWNGRAELNPWPVVELFTDVEAFVTQMLLDAQAYS